MPDEVVQEEHTFVAQGVTFDGKHSYTDYGMWLMQRPDLGSPSPKLSIVNIPGADGNIDLTEANTGEVKYENRRIVFQFGAVVEQSDQEAFRAKIMDELHGARISRIILDEDTNWYWTGRATVVFSNVKSWRLNCTIAIDAYPFAMKVNETTVDLTGGTISTNSVVIGEDKSARDFNTDIWLGSVDFPEGLPTASEQNLIVSWGANPTLGINVSKQIQVVDSDGIVYVASFTLPQTDNHYIIAFSTLTSADVDVAKVYRIRVIGIGGCVASVRKSSVRITIQNTKKTVQPMFWLSASYPINIVWDGIQQQIEDGVHSYDDIVLREGTTNVYIPALGADVDGFYVKFREGKL